MTSCNRCNEDITWKQSKRGKWYAVNEDNSFHNNTCKKVSKGEFSPFEKSQSLEQEPIVTTADKLLEENRINNLKLVVNRWKEQFDYYELDLVIKEKGVA